MFPSRFKSVARASLLAAALVLCVPVARAQVAAPIEPDGAGKLAAYTACAGGLALANTFPQAWASLSLCFKIIADEWNRTF